MQPWTMPIYGLMGERARGGLMGGEGQDASQPSPSFWERLSRIWAGRQDPRLSQEQEKQTRDDALMAASLQLLMSSNDPYGNPNLLGLLAQSAATGQAYAGAARQQAVDKNRKARLLEAVQGGQVNDQMLDQLFAEALAQGDVDSARILSEVIKSRKSGAGALKTVQTDTETIVLGPGGEEIRRYPRQADLERVDTGDAVVWYDQNQNEVKRVAKRPAPGMEDQRKFQQSNQLLTRFQSQTKDDKTVADLYGAVMAAAQDPSPAGDLALLFAYMKVLDPGSVVRESEFAAAARAGSLPQRINAQVLRVLNGERLTDTQRADFISQATAVAKMRATRLQKVVQYYRDMAERRGLNPEDVAFNYFEMFFPTVQGAQPAGGGAPAPSGQTGGVLDGYLEK